MNFNFLKLLDKGSFSEVYLLKEANTNHLYAGKLIKTHKLNQKELSLFQNEKKILRSFVSYPNRNIIALYKVFRFEGIGNELLVLEYCNGGSLHNCLNNYIIKNGKPFPEDLVRYLMKQILNGVKSLHERGIIHRDLKLNNILLKYNNNNDLINQNIYAAEIKIIDFNTSYCPDISGPKTILGTFPNMAPSIINNAFGFGNIKTYDEKIDIWSLGTLCYEMLFGKPLFGNIQNYEMIQNILSCNFYIPKTISSQARSFLYSMLQKHGINRLSAAQLLNHDFIAGNNYFVTSDKEKNEPDIDSHFLNIKKEIPINSSRIDIPKNNHLGNGFRYFRLLTKAGKYQNGKTKTDQDAPLVKLNVGDIPGFNLFGVLDGHGPDGHYVSRFCRDYFISKMIYYADYCKKKGLYTPEAIYEELKKNKICLYYKYF